MFTCKKLLLKRLLKKVSVFLKLYRFPVWKQSWNFCLYNIQKYILKRLQEHIVGVSALTRCVVHSNSDRDMKQVNFFLISPHYKSIVQLHLIFPAREGFCLNPPAFRRLKILININLWDYIWDSSIFVFPLSEK